MISLTAIVPQRVSTDRQRSEQTDREQRPVRIHDVTQNRQLRSFAGPTTMALPGMLVRHDQANRPTRSNPRPCNEITEPSRMARSCADHGTIPGKAWRRRSTNPPARSCVAHQSDDKCFVSFPFRGSRTLCATADPRPKGSGLAQIQITARHFG